MNQRGGGGCNCSGELCGLIVYMSVLYIYNSEMEKRRSNYN